MFQLIRGGKTPALQVHPTRVILRQLAAMALLPEQVALSIADQALGSLTNGLTLASAYLEEQIEAKKNRLYIPEIGPRGF